MIQHLFSLALLSICILNVLGCGHSRIQEANGGRSQESTGDSRTSPQGVRDPGSQQETQTVTPSPSSPSPSSSSQSVTPSPFLLQEELLNQSQITIEYILGRETYRFKIRATQGIVTASTYLENDLIEKGALEPTRFKEYATKVVDFITLNRKNRVSDDSTLCKRPFSITFKIGKQIKSTKGCRNLGEKTFSQLLKEGEFLLYSKK